MTDVFERAWMQMPERELQERLEHLMRELRQPYFHDNYSRQNNAGLPDLLVPVPPVLYVSELKAMSGRVTQAQALWLHVLGQCERIETMQIRPTGYESFRDAVLIPFYERRLAGKFTDSVTALADTIDEQKRANRTRANIARRRNRMGR